MQTSMRPIAATSNNGGARTGRQAATIPSLTSTRSQRGCYPPGDGRRVLRALQAHYRDVRALLEGAYDERDTARCGVGDFTAGLPQEDVQRMQHLSSTQGSFAWTYGELTFDGAAQLKELLDVSACDVFYDLGSGLGRLVLQAHLQWGVARSVGVELSGDRHQKAVTAAQSLSARGCLDPSRRISLINDNLLACDVSDATCVYLACTCWDSDFMTQVLALLESGAPRLRYLVCTEELERKFWLRPAWLRLERCERVSQTWAPEGYPLHIYTPVSQSAL